MLKLSTLSALVLLSLQCVPSTLASDAPEPAPAQNNGRGFTFAFKTESSGHLPKRAYQPNPNLRPLAAHDRRQRRGFQPLVPGKSVERSVDPVKELIANNKILDKLDGLLGKRGSSNHAGSTGPTLKLNQDLDLFGPTVTIGTPAQKLNLVIKTSDPVSYLLLDTLKASTPTFKYDASSTARRRKEKFIFKGEEGLETFYFTDQLALGGLHPFSQTFLGYKTLPAGKSPEDIWPMLVKFAGQLGLGKRDKTTVGPTFMEALKHAGLIDKMQYGIRLDSLPAMTGSIHFGELAVSASTAALKWSQVLTKYKDLPFTIPGDGFIVDNHLITSTAGPVQLEIGSRTISMRVETAKALFAHVPNSYLDEDMGVYVFECETTHKVGYSVRGQQYSMPLKELLISEGPKGKNGVQCYSKFEIIDNTVPEAEVTIIGGVFMTVGPERRVGQR
ncbi:BQ2448_6117 [Microbotryum intermedium]|uniref:BQ2448_6117 protein n=1 Tax=Microbotryum intermedium TaxID=269621 RepID=A0A238FKA5_9BASI|nr:BQ2448_6117 [Microbotryum intermedium]